MAEIKLLCREELFGMRNTGGGGRSVCRFGRRKENGCGWMRFENREEGGTRRKAEGRGDNGRIG